MDLSLEQQYLKDMEVIKKEMEPFLHSLEEQKVDMFSFIIFLASYLKELLKEVDSKKKRELIIRSILDEDYD